MSYYFNPHQDSAFTAGNFDVTAFSASSEEKTQDASSSPMHVTADNVNEASGFTKTAGTGKTNVVEIRDEATLKALREGGKEGETCSFDNETVDRLVDGVMQQLHGGEAREVKSNRAQNPHNLEETAQTNLVKRSLSNFQAVAQTSEPGSQEYEDAKAELKGAVQTAGLVKNAQSNFEAVAKTSKPGSQEYEKAKSDLKEAKQIVRQEVNKELKEARADLTEKGKIFTNLQVRHKAIEKSLKGLQGAVDKQRDMFEENGLEPSPEFHELEANLNESKKDYSASKAAVASAEESLKKAEDRCQHATRDVVETVVRFSLENRNAGKGGDVYLRPDATKLAVPVTVTQKGDIIISLKSKELGDFLGKGGFKIVKTALVLSFDLKEVGNVTIAKEVSATMTPKSEVDKKALDNEKNMLTRLVQLGEEDPPPEGIVKCRTVVSYQQKENKAAHGGEKIGVIMEFCDGGDLEKSIDKGKLSQGETKTVVHDILSGLAYLHDHNIFHSDMKPANVLLDTVDGEIRAKLADFGCSKDLNNTVDENQRVYFTGDRAYHSPELKGMDQKLQAARKADPEYAAKYEPAVKKVEDAQAAFKRAESKLAEKVKQFEELSKTGTPDEMAAAQKWVSAFGENVKANFQAYNAAIKERDDILESIDSKYRSEVYSIDEKILTSDVYAAGMIFESLFKGKSLSAGMVDLIKAMKEDVTDKKTPRISSQEALKRFNELKGEIFVTSEVQPEAGAAKDDDKTDQTVTLPKGKGVYAVPEQDTPIIVPNYSVKAITGMTLPYSVAL